MTIEEIRVFVTSFLLGYPGATPGNALAINEDGTGIEWKDLNIAVPTTSTTTTSTSTTTTTTASTTTTTTIDNGNSATLVIVGGQSNATPITSPVEFWSPYSVAEITPKMKIWSPDVADFETLRIEFPYGAGNATGNGTANGITNAVPIIAGVELPLLKALSLNNGGKTAYIVKHAIGATHLFQNEEVDWNSASTGEYFDQMKAKAIAARNKLLLTYDSVILKFFWLQGESDTWAGISQSQYYNDLTALHTELCTDLGQANIPTALMQLHINGGGASPSQKDAVRAAQAQFVGDSPSTRKLISIDSFLLRDNYHFFADTYTYLAEEAIELFLGTTVTNSTPPPEFSKATFWQSPYPWYWNGGDNYIGQSGFTRDAAFISGVGGIISLQMNGTAGELHLAQLHDGASNEFGFGWDGGSTITPLFGSTAQGSSISLVVGRHYGIKITSGGVASLVSSTDGVTFGTTHHTFSQSALGNNYWVNCSMPFLVSWSNLKFTSF